MNEPRAEILLLAENALAVSGLFEFVRQCGFDCRIATPATARELLQSHAFVFVISMFPLAQQHPLVLLLAGTDCTIFYRLAVEDDCWWVPLEGKNRKELGRPALRAAEFTEFLQQAADQARLRRPGANPADPAPAVERGDGPAALTAGGGQ